MVTKLNKKVCLIGDFAVGKTSLVRRFVHDRYDDKYISTMGVKVSRKNVTITTGSALVEINIMLWDLAGGEAFNQVQASYFRGAAGAVLVCDVTRAETLASAKVYAQNFRQVNPEAALVLALNKSDLTNEQQLKVSHVEPIAADLKAAYYLTSAKTGENVEAMFRHLGKLLIRSGNSRK